jgi:hypothetical protein
MDGDVTALAVFDDGSEPRPSRALLHERRSSGESDRAVMARTVWRWATEGQPVVALTVFDDGSGAALYVGSLHEAAAWGQSDREVGRRPLVGGGG